MLLTSDSYNYEIRENKNNNNINENINNNKYNKFDNKTTSIFNMSNNSFIPEYSNKYKNYNNEENIDIECICEFKNYNSKKDLIQCILCLKFQHISCIHQAQYTTPYLCFNCQFKNNHFYLKWKKTILPAKEIIYKKKWEEDITLLKEGTKKFEFYLNLNELYSLYNYDKNNSHYLAFLCLTNNGKPFHLGFPDNINIQINNKQFYFTESKGFKRPLLLALDNTPFYVPKKRHLITLDKYEIPNASDFFFIPKSNVLNQDKYMQKVTISFANSLENYRGSEFEFVEERHYLFYIGVFQEIKIPQLNILRNCNDLKQYFDLFKNLYNEKVIRLKWSKVSNYVTLGNDQMNMNLISNVSNQRILHPIRGLFCQHSDVLDYGECCGYITSNSQVYKCFKCNKPLNIMYIDDMSEKIFNKYRNENYSQIYYTNKFKFIRGEKINDGKDKTERKNNDDMYNEEDSLSESFFEFYQKKDNLNNNENYENNREELYNNNVNEEIIELNSSSESINDYNNSNPNENQNRDNIIFNSNNMDFNINFNNINNNNSNINKSIENIKGNYMYEIKILIIH